jgi:4-amino-4-deoxy-L-arabinose transferase-like glycosyltransferase
LPPISWKRWALGLLCTGALFFLYLFGLTRTGLLGPDEPRYAAIGRAMADSGDWITPRLWGNPWFEKPPLLYWMTAASFKAGLGPDLAPRLPVAILSVGFLMYFFAALRREFGATPAFYATTILATSAGWLAYSHVAITDLPMSVAFAAAMLMVLTPPFTSGRPTAVAAGALLGLAVLAKGLVPLVLFLPAVVFWRRRPYNLLLLFATATIVALPWYALVTLRNGAPFLEEFFWKHHFERFTTSALQHEQPFWFYVPVLAAGLFPWSPLLLLLFQQRTSERRTLFLLAWFAWGFLFFSISRNKLPGYLLPLLPPIAALLGVALAEAKSGSVKILCLLAASSALLWFVPAILEILPQALLQGASHTEGRLAMGWIVPTLIIVAACAVLEMRRHRSLAVGLIALLVTISVIELIARVYPELNRTVSARSLWHSDSITCIPTPNRSRRYGLYYYAGGTLPDCN